MKVRAERKALADTLSWVAQAIPKRPQMPALGGMRLTASDGALHARAFDYEISHAARIDADVASNGECLVSGQFLAEIVSSLKGDVVELVLDGGRLTISCGRAVYGTQVLSLEDYPTLPEQPETVGVVSADVLVEAVAACKVMVDANSVFGSLSGVHLDGDESGTLISVGLHRAGGVECTATWSCDKAFAATIPSRMLDAATRGLRDDVVIGFDGGVLGLAATDRAVTIRTLAEAFPNWRVVLRDAAADVFSVVAERDDLIEVTKRAGMLASDKVPVVLTISASEIEIQVESGEKGGGTDSVIAESTGAGRLALHSPYFLEALAAMPPGPVRLGLGNTEGRIQPVIIRPLDTTGRVSMVQPKKIPGGLT